MSEPKFSIVVRCPRCGSTDASGDGAVSAPPGFVWMGCNHCQFVQLCDDTQTRLDWNAYVSRQPEEPLPSFVFVGGRLRATLAQFVGRLDDDAWDNEPATFVAHRTLSTAWQEPHRRYHTLQHLGACLRWFDDPQVQALLQHPAEVELALFYHDVVYDTARSDNEERSADIARAQLIALPGADAEAVERVCKLVLATRDHVANSPDAQVLIDIDLAILGAAPDDYDTFEQQIRQEFHWVPEEMYRNGRMRVLTSFQQRPRLYATDRLYDALEDAARANLARTVSALVVGEPTPTAAPETLGSGDTSHSSC